MCSMQLERQMERFHTLEDFHSDPRYRAPGSDRPLPSSQKPVRPAHALHVLRAAKRDAGLKQSRCSIRRYGVKDGLACAGGPPGQ